MGLSAREAVRGAARPGLGIAAFILWGILQSAVPHTNGHRDLTRDAERAAVMVVDNTHCPPLALGSLDVGFGRYDFDPEEARAFRALFVEAKLRGLQGLPDATGRAFRQRCDSLAARARPGSASPTVIKTGVKPRSGMPKRVMFSV